MTVALKQRRALTGDPGPGGAVGLPTGNEAPGSRLEDPARSQYAAGSGQRGTVRRELIAGGSSAGAGRN